MKPLSGLVAVLASSSILAGCEHKTTPTTPKYVNGKIHSIIYTVDSYGTYRLEFDITEDTKDPRHHPCKINSSNGCPAVANKIYENAQVQLDMSGVEIRNGLWSISGADYIWVFPEDRDN